MHWFGRARLLVLTLICLFWTGLILIGHFLPTAPFISVPWRGEQSFEDLLRREGRKTTPPSDFVFLAIDQSTLQLAQLTPEELAESRGLQLLSERPLPRQSCRQRQLRLPKRSAGHYSKCDADSAAAIAGQPGGFREFLAGSNRRQNSRCDISC